MLPVTVVLCASAAIEPEKAISRLAQCSDPVKLAATIARSVQAGLQAELRAVERAVTAGIRDAGRGLRTELRQQVTSAGLGQRLANSWRDKHYPNQKLDAASLVYTKRRRSSALSMRAQ
jgi:hypothetical protein